MCIVHDPSLHYLFQNMLDAFERSKMLSSLFMKRVGRLVCTCKTDMYYDSSTIIATQRGLYQWFASSSSSSSATSGSSSRLAAFRSFVDELRENGRVDSGTKITFMLLLRDLDLYDYSKLRALCYVDANNQHYQRHNQVAADTAATRTRYTHTHPHMFFVKLVRLKFDLNLCSAKEFQHLVCNIDNQAIRYIEIVNKCKISVRQPDHFRLVNFMGELETTIEVRFKLLFFFFLKTFVQYELSKTTKIGKKRAQLVSCRVVGEASGGRNPLPPRQEDTVVRLGLVVVVARGVERRRLPRRAAPVAARVQAEHAQRHVARPQHRLDVVVGVGVGVAIAIGGRRVAYRLAQKRNSNTRVNKPSHGRQAERLDTQRGGARRRHRHRRLRRRRARRPRVSRQHDAHD